MFRSTHHTPPHHDKKSSTPVLLKYFGVSGLQTIAELGIFTILHFFIDRQIANACAIVCSATLQFTLNRNVTFKSSSNIARSAVLFVMLWCWNLAFSAFMLAIVPPLGADPIIVKLCCMGCQAIWGWLLSRYVIFV